MSEIDQKIREAALALGQALTEGGKDYYVHCHSIEVTTIESEGSQFAWTVYVSEQTNRDIAP